MATTGVELATAYVTLAVSTRGMEKDIRRQFAGVERDAGKTGRAAGKAMGGGLVASAKSFAGPLVAAFGIGAVVSQVKGAVDEASNLQQALGGAEAVFKKQLDDITGAADEAAEALGLSRTQYLDLATALGASLKNKGIENFAGEASLLIQLGADLAAQFGGPVPDAVDAISSALRGEMDPIERYGVALNEAALKAEAVRLGLHKGKGPLKDNVKAQAALSLLTKQTADAQGAFARESDTLAGKQARLSATWDNLKADLGEKLLPVLTDVADWFLKDGLPAIQDFGKWVDDNLGPTIQNLGEWFEGDALPAIQTFANYVTDELWPALKDGWETIQPGLERAKEIIEDTFSGSNGDGMKEFGRILVEDIIPAIATLANTWLPVAATQFSLVVEAIRKVGAFFQLQMDVAKWFFTTIIDGFIGVTSVAITMLEALSEVPGFDWAAGVADKLRGIVGEAEAVKDAINNIPNNVPVRVSFTTTGEVRLPNGVAVDMGVWKMREHGGPVQKGQPYIVGEKRPELFVPNQSGKILPRVPDSAGFGGDSDGAVRDSRLAQMIANQLQNVELAVGVNDMRRGIRSDARRGVLSSPGRA